MAKNLNVLFIGIDTLRADHLRCHGYARRTSPNIDRIASQGALFLNAFAPGIPTHPGWTTLLTGVHPLVHKITGMNNPDSFLDENILQIQEILQRHGWRTAAADAMAHHGELRGFIKAIGTWESGSWFSRGFEFYMADKHRRIRPEWQKPPASLITDIGIEWLDEWSKMKGNFFLWLHYWDPHGPYVPPQAFVDRFYGGDKNNPYNRSWEKTSEKLVQLHRDEGLTDIEYVIAQYDGEIAFCDNEIGRLLEHLDHLGVTDETLVVVAADHGEIMTEHDCYFSHYALYEGDIHIPLIFKCPGAVPRCRVDALVQHQDMAPTILDILGIPEASRGMDGMTLLPFMHGEKTEGYPEIVTFENCWYKYLGIRTKEWKLLKSLELDRHGHPEGWTELYDMQHDPKEETNVIKSEPEVGEELEKRMNNLIDSLLKGKPNPVLEQPTSLRAARGPLGEWIPKELYPFKVYPFKNPSPWRPDSQKK